MTTIFHNKSLLPLECISTFGVSAKETDSPIGYFGTGLKYAIATMLREECEVIIFIDGVEYTFTTERKAIRNQDFGFVYMNGTQLPFTTELGRNWKLWQAYRELYSNCVDEGGTVEAVEDWAQMDFATGTFIITTGLDEIHAASNEFVLRSTAKHVIGDVEIHESKEPGIFYKGIKVLDLPTFYTYNVLRGLTLTEDRTVAQWDAEHAITSALLETENLEALMDVLSIDDEQYQEAKFNWSRYQTPSETFMRLVAKLKNKSHALSTYYGYHEAAFLGKLDRGFLSESVKRKLNKLRNSVAYKPAEIFVANMDGDYKIITEGVVLNIALLANQKKLQFVYSLACHKMKNKCHHKSDYDAIVQFMLPDFTFTSVQQKRIKNSRPAKLAA